jgi:hypothetical protein
MAREPLRQQVSRSYAIIVTYISFSCITRVDLEEKCLKNIKGKLKNKKFDFVINVQKYSHTSYTCLIFFRKYSVFNAFVLKVRSCRYSIKIKSVRLGFKLLLHRSVPFISFISTNHLVVPDMLIDWLLCFVNKLHLVAKLSATLARSLSQILLQGLVILMQVLFFFFYRTWRQKSDHRSLFYEWDGHVKCVTVLSLFRLILSVLPHHL